MRWLFNPTFGPAFFGLIGVVVGGVITAVTSYVLDRRRESREAQREERSRSREIKRAARLLDVELARARATVAMTTEKKAWYDDDSAFRAGDWNQHLSVVAPELSQEAWEQLIVAQVAFEQFITQYNLFFKNIPNASRALSENVVSHHQNTLGTIDLAREGPQSLLKQGVKGVNLRISAPRKVGIKT